MATDDSSITEGKARVFTCSNIFYNPVQEFNRDLSVLALTVFAEQFENTGCGKASKRRHHENESKTELESKLGTKKDGVIVLEALAATGLRSIRYALEVPNIRTILANDCSLRAVEAIRRNTKENGVEHLVDAVNHDAIWLMQKINFENKSVHVIDLDPYGCPTKFLDSAVNCIGDGGLLMITCTDMAVIAGNTPETCYVKYGSVSLRSSSCHEMALRIALSCVAGHCGRYGKYIVPLLSVSADFYIRIFLRVYYSQKMSKQTSSNISLVYQCTGCEMMTLQPLGVTVPRNNNNNKFLLPTGPPVNEQCVHCNHKHKLGGPIWSGQLHDSNFVGAMLSKINAIELATSKRIIGMLSLIQEELNDVPLYYTIESLCSKLHCQMIPLVDFRSALLNAGYRVSLSHCKTNSVKTNAPQSFIWDILRCWVKKNPVSEKRLLNNSVTIAILGRSPQHEIDFKFCKNAVPDSAASGLLRYQQNPMPNWGPGIRAKSNVLNDVTSHKRLRNQNKKSHLKASTNMEAPTADLVESPAEMK